MVNETKTDTENPSKWGDFGVEVSNKSKCDEKYLLRVFL